MFQSQFALYRAIAWTVFSTYSVFDMGALSQEFQVSATNSSLQVRNVIKATLVFDAKLIAKTGFSAYSRAMQGSQTGKCTYRRTFQPLTLIGRFFTYRDTLDTSCAAEAHPSYTSRVTTVDLASSNALVYDDSADDPLTISPSAKNKSKIVALNDWFSASEIGTALAKDPLLHNSLQPGMALSDIPAALGETGIALKGTDCRFTLAADFLTRFRIQDRRGPNLAIRVQLSPLGGACRSTVAELGILLPLPSVLVRQLPPGPVKQIDNEYIRTTLEFSLDTER